MSNCIFINGGASDIQLSQKIRILLQFLQVFLLFGNLAFGKEVKEVSLEFERVVQVRQQQQIHSILVIYTFDQAVLTQGLQ